MNRFITGTNVLLVILVAIGSFSLSYSALSDLAAKNGFTDWRAYVLPLVIDIGMLAFGLAVVHAHLHSTNPLRRRLLNLLYTAVTVVYNLIHAPNNLTAQGLAIIPPLTLFFTFEVLMAMIEHNIKRNQEQATIAGYDTALQTAQAGFNELMAQVETIQTQNEKALSLLREQYAADTQERDNKLAELQQALEVASDPVSHRRERVLSLVENYRAEFGEEPTQVYLSEKTGVSVQTIRGDLKVLNGSISHKGA